MMEITAAMIAGGMVQFSGRRGVLRWLDTHSELPVAARNLVVGRVRFAQVMTNGDGACDIHAVFGQPTLAQDDTWELFC